MLTLLLVFMLLTSYMQFYKYALMMEPSFALESLIDSQMRHKS